MSKTSIYHQQLQTLQSDGFDLSKLKIVYVHNQKPVTAEQALKTAEIAGPISMELTNVYASGVASAISTYLNNRELILNPPLETFEQINNSAKKLLKLEMLLAERFYRVGFHDWYSLISEKLDITARSIKTATENTSVEEMTAYYLQKQIDKRWQKLKTVSWFSEETKQNITTQRDELANFTKTQLPSLIKEIAERDRWHLGGVKFLEPYETIMFSTKDMRGKQLALFPEARMLDLNLQPPGRDIHLLLLENNTELIETLVGLHTHTQPYYDLHKCLEVAENL